MGLPLERLNFLDRTREIGVLSASGSYSTQGINACFVCRFPVICLRGALRASGVVPESLQRTLRNTLAEADAGRDRKRTPLITGTVRDRTHSTWSTFHHASRVSLWGWSHEVSFLPIALHRHFLGLFDSRLDEEIPDPYVGPGSLQVVFRLGYRGECPTY